VVPSRISALLRSASLPPVGNAIPKVRDAIALFG